MGKIGELIVALGADNKDLKKGMKESKDIIQSAMDTISSMKAELLSIGAIAGPLATVKSWALAVNDLEDKTNMAGESASRLLAVGQYVGLTTEDMSGAMAKMSKTVLTAAESIATASANGSVSTDVFTKFGIQILDNNGKLLSAEQILSNVADKHRLMANGVEKTDMEMEIFGRTGAKLNDLLNLSEEQMQGVYDTAQKTGLVLSHETTQAFEDAEFAINKGSLAVKGLTASIGAEMLPQFKAMSEFLTDAAEDFASLDDEQRKNIATLFEVAGAVSAVSIGWRGVVYISGPAIAAIKSVASAYDILAASAWGAKAAVASVILSIAAAAAYKGYQDYQHYQAGGEFEYDDLGNVTQKQGTSYTQYSSDDWDTVSPNFNTSTGEYDIKQDTTPGTVDFSGAGKGKSDKSAEQAVKEISEINKQISELQQKSSGFAAEWTQTELQIAKAAVDGGALILANIYTEGEARKKAVDDWVDKVSDAVVEAQQIYERAVKSGDDDAIASAEAMLEERKNAEIQAAQEAADAKKEIDRQTISELMSNATQLQEFKAELDESMRQGDYERFITSMTDENVAFAEQMAEKQAVMQQYYDWRMEAEESFTMFALQAAEQLKTGLGQAAAGALVYGQSFKKAMKDMIKQIAAMYVAWAVEKLAANALSKLLMKQETSAVAAQGAAMAEALAPAAWAKLVVSPGSAAIATGLLTAGMSAAAAIGGGIGTLSGSGTTSEPGTVSSGGDISGGTYSINGATATGLASGGVITAPTFALIGEGGEDEAVSPISTLRGMIADLFEEHGSEGGSIIATQNIYGGIHTGADADEMYSGFGNMLLSSLRGS